MTTHNLARVDVSFALGGNLFPSLDSLAELHSEPTTLVQHLKQCDGLVIWLEDRFAILLEPSQDLLRSFFEWRVDGCHIGVEAQCTLVHQSQVAC